MLLLCCWTVTSELLTYESQWTSYCLIVKVFAVSLQFFETSYLQSAIFFCINLCKVPGLGMKYDFTGLQGAIKKTVNCDTFYHHITLGIGIDKVLLIPMPLSNISIPLGHTILMGGPFLLRFYHAFSHSKFNNLRCTIRLPQLHIHIQRLLICCVRKCVSDTNNPS